MDGFLYGSGLALSGAFAPAPPKGEPLAKPETLPYCQGLSLWERWHRVAMTERARTLTAARLLPVTTPLVKKGFRKVRRLS